MITAWPPTSSGSSQRRLALHMLAAASGIIGLLLAAGWIGGLRINTTPSEPLGVWRIVPLTSPVRDGQMVFICPPDSAVMREGLRRGYLRAGLCPGGFGPLIKTVLALDGQRVDVIDGVIIDGRPVANSRVVARDGMGRSLLPYAGGIIPPGAVFLHSPFVGSWDSRYFGPVTVSGVLGLAEKVLTYAP